MEGSGSTAEKAVPALELPAPGTSTGGLASGRAAACETLVARPGAAAAVQPEDSAVALKSSGRWRGAVGWHQADQCDERCENRLVQPGRGQRTVR